MQKGCPSFSVHEFYGVVLGAGIFEVVAIVIAIGKIGPFGRGKVDRDPGRHIVTAPQFRCVVVENQFINTTAQGGDVRREVREGVLRA